MRAGTHRQASSQSDTFSLLSFPWKWESIFFKNLFFREILFILKEEGIGNPSFIKVNPYPFLFKTILNLICFYSTGIVTVIDQSPVMVALFSPE